MVEPPSSDASARVSQLLTQAEDRQVPSAELVQLVYADLRKIASARLRQLGPGQTLQPTALVHEAYMRLVGSTDPGWAGRTHFLGAAARAMRDVVIRSLENRASLKRGGQFRRLDPDAALELSAEGPNLDVEALNEALERLEVEHPRAAEVVSLRFFGGMTAEEIAAALDLSSRTVEREWRFARAWFSSAISGEEQDA